MIGGKSNTVAENWWNRTCMLLLWGVLCYALIWAVMESWNDAISFDGAMNAQVSQNLSEGRGYQSSYGDDRPFDHRIQTGATYLLPVALLYRLFGPSMEVAVLVNAFFLMVLLCCVVWWVARRTHSNFAALIAVGLILLTPRISELAFGGYGEVVSLSLFMASLCLMEKLGESSRIGWAVAIGICLSLVYLAKTVGLILVGAAVVGFVLGILPHQKRRWSLFAGLVCGLVLPIAMFEGYKLLSLGGHEYIGWWKIELGLISRQAGAQQGFADTKGVLPKVLRHWNVLLSSYSGMPPTMLLLLAGSMAVWPMLMLRRAVVERRVNGGELATCLALLIYIVWWMAVTPTQKAYARRVFNGMIILDVAIVLTAMALFGAAAKRALARRRVMCWLCAAVGALMLVAAMVEAAPQWPQLALCTIPTREKEDAVAFARYIRRLHDSGGVMYGTGWWQAPVASLIAQVPVANIDTADPARVEREDAYLLADRYLVQLLPTDLDDALAKYRNHEMCHFGRNRIYALDDYAGVPSFTDAQRAQATASSLHIADSLDGLASGCYGYEPMNHGRWLARLSRFLLKRDTQKRGVVTFYTPKPSQYSESPVILRVLVDDNECARYIVGREGLHTVAFDLPESIAEGRTLELALKFHSRLVTKNGDQRELSALLLRLGLESPPPGQITGIQPAGVKQ